MKVLDVSAITDSSEMPLKQGSISFLQQANKETIADLIIALIGPSYLTNTVYVLSGCENTGPYPIYNISAGVVFYNAEVYEVDPASFTALGSNVAVFVLAVTQYTLNADPVTFSDMAVRNIHNIRKFALVQGASGSGLGDLSAAFYMNLVIPKQLNLTAPVTPIAFAGNHTQLIGSYPDLQLFVPPASNLNPILASGTENVGDIPDGTANRDWTVTFATPLLTSNYMVMGSIVSQGTPLFDTTILWSVRNRTNTGFTIHFREDVFGVNNIAFDWICFAK